MYLHNEHRLLFKRVEKWIFSIYFKRNKRKFDGKNALTHYILLDTESDNIGFPNGEKPALVLPLLFLDYNTGIFCLYVNLMHILSCLT